MTAWYPLLGLLAAIACGSHTVPSAAKPAGPVPASWKPKIMLESAPPYQAGFPMLVAVTVANEERGLLLSDLPRVGVFDDPLLLRWVARSSAGEETVLSSGLIPVEEHDSGGFELDFGERQTMVADLSEVALELQPGEYVLRVGYPLGEFVESEPITFGVLAPPGDDAAFAHRVLAGAARGHFGAFVQPEGAELPAFPDTLSARGRRLLAWHEFVHRAMRDPRSLAQQPLEGLEEIRGGFLDAERDVLRYELLEARSDPAARGVREAIEERWPGWVWRLVQVDGGSGVLTSQRERWGRTHGRR